MRRYEAMFIVDAELSDEQLDPILQKYSKIVTDMGGTVTQTGKWEQGRRRMAYEINDRREGLYVLMYFTANTDVPKELDRVFRISDDVIRHMIVLQDESLPMAAPAQAPPEATAPAAAPEQAPVPAAAEEAPEPTAEPAAAEAPEAEAAPEPAEKEPEAAPEEAAPPEPEASTEASE